ncbi:MAG: adenylate/guanylate cyclase domain-containing protein, partial [Pseudomonadota bacterium]
MESSLGTLESSSAFLRNLRLFLGLVLFFYLVTHIINNALGLISLQAMESCREWVVLLWRNPLGTALLYGALCLHMALSLWTLYQRRHFRIPLWEAVQILLGLVIPLLLVIHIVGTRISHEWFGTTDSYTALVLIFWELRPDLGLKQALLLTAAWLHGCMALHYWLRLKSWYVPLVPTLFGLALLLPALSLLGFSQAGREVSRSARQSGWGNRIMSRTMSLRPPESALLGKVGNAALNGFAAGIVLIFMARAVRSLQKRSRKKIVITYPGDKKVAVPVGFTVLDASRYAGIQHVSACGGRGRCSTCRVRLISGMEFLHPYTVEELNVLHHIGAPPNVRLACQLRPKKDLSVFPLISSRSHALEYKTQLGIMAGEEKNIAVLFADLRGFTAIAEGKLPYDVVFLLNRYFDVAGEVIEKEGGIANQFTGDGVMALFGLKGTDKEGCLQALSAACRMVDALADLSMDLKEELKQPLKIGIGIHTGPAVVGHMGHGVATYLTAVGDTVHVASRLEELTKEYGCPIIISDRVAERAGIDASPFPRYQLLVRNRSHPIVILAVE